MVSDVKTIPAPFPVVFPEMRMRRAHKMEKEIYLFLKHQHSGFFGQLVHEQELARFLRSVTSSILTDYFIAFWKK